MELYRGICFDCTGSFFHFQEMVIFGTKNID
jgi:hypothetical protein